MKSKARPHPGTLQSADVLGLMREQLDKRLLAYTLAGTGALVFAPLAHSQIIYTPTDIAIGAGSTLQIDLNNDGTFDFNVSNAVSTLCFTDGGSSCTFFADQQRLKVNGNGNLDAAVMGKLSPGALALPYGRTIGPPNLFRFTDVQAQSLNMACVSFQSSARTFTSSNASGKFQNVSHRFLGLQFEFNNEVHYGWAQFQVSSSPNRMSFNLSPTLKGYAYEAQPNTPILAGNTGLDSNVQTGANAVPSLRLLSLGRKGLKRWRRQEGAPSSVSPTYTNCQ